MSVAVAFPCCVELLSFVKILVFALIKVLARFVIFDIFEHLTMACICNQQNLQWPIKFPIKDFFSKCEVIASVISSVTFTEEIYNEKLHFLCSAICYISGSFMTGLITGEIHMSGFVTSKFRTVELNMNFTSYES